MNYLRTTSNLIVRELCAEVEDAGVADKVEATNMVNVGRILWKEQTGEWITVFSGI